MRPERRGITLALLAGAAATATTVAVPAVIGAGVDQILQRDRTGLFTAVAALTALALLRLVLFRQSELLLISVGERVVRALRELAVTRLSWAPLRFLERFRRRPRRPLRRPAPPHAAASCSSRSAST